MQITEIYKSIQGESTHAGCRASLCGLRAAICVVPGVTASTRSPAGIAGRMEEVMQEVERLSPGGGLVEITGGEPMLQEREVVP